MNLLADSNLLTPGVIEAALSVLSAVSLAGVGLFKMIYTKQEARIDALIAASEKKDDRYLESMGKAVEALTLSAEVGKQMMAATAVAEDRNREARRSGGR
jgi:hypothetical protein